MRAQGAWRLFSSQDWASSPAGHEMSCRDVIVGHSVSGEWTSEVQLCFSLSFSGTKSASLLSGLTVKGQKAAAIRILTRMEYKRGPVGRPGPLCWNVQQHKGLVRGTQEGQQLSLPLAGLVCSGPWRDFLFPWLHHLRFGLVSPECRVV